MRIGILTSSRADYGIYLPLLKRLQADKFFELNIIAFGTHLSSFHGETVRQILDNGFEVKYRVESMLLTDSAQSISTAMGLTVIKFSDFWEMNGSNFDLVFCLGDRYEMFAAVSAGIPFNIPFAHLHGGETTLGAIDNIFRHAITLAAKYHFVATSQYAKRVEEITGSADKIYDVGALSLENLSDLTLLETSEFEKKWGINLDISTVLVTFHPETVDAASNVHHINELVSVIQRNPNFQFLITMPNADTAGNIIRAILLKELGENRHVFLVENLGSQSYFTAMKYCAFLLGNTSSGIIEAASFNKYVINLGNRQKGRACGENVYHVDVKASSIQTIMDEITNNQVYKGKNIYYKEHSADAVVNVIKNIGSYAKS